MPLSAVELRLRNACQMPHFRVTDSITDSVTDSITPPCPTSGATAEVVDASYGCTPLHWAASKGDQTLCHSLMTSGARVDTQVTAGTSYLIRFGFDGVQYPHEDYGTLSISCE